MPMPTALVLQLRPVDGVEIGQGGGDFQEVSLQVKFHAELRYKITYCTHVGSILDLKVH